MLAHGQAVTTYRAIPGSYPRVVGEYQTVCKLLEGYSIARIGDGELKLMCGFGINREPANPKIQIELMNSSLFPHPMCLPGIWTYDRAGPKYENMLRHQYRFMSVMSSRVEYYSSFISRPDCAPWIRTKGYAQLVERLWSGKRAAVVCERKGSIWTAVRRQAGSMTHVECPHAGAYAEIDALEAAVVAAKPQIAILSAGATATCLANRLATRGIQSIDLGSAGKFLNEMLALPDA